MKKIRTNWRSPWSIERIEWLFERTVVVPDQGSVLKCYRKVR